MWQKMLYIPIWTPDTGVFNVSSSSCFLAWTQLSTPSVWTFTYFFVLAGSAVFQSVFSSWMDSLDSQDLEKGQCPHPPSWSKFILFACFVSLVSTFLFVSILLEYASFSVFSKTGFYPNYNSQFIYVFIIYIKQIPPS